MKNLPYLRQKRVYLLQRLEFFNLGAIYEKTF
jgi:hypothetical protein